MDVDRGRREPRFRAFPDLTTKTFLSLIEQTGGAGVWATRRVRIEHGNGITPDLLPQVRNLGVVVVVNPTHASLAGQPDRAMLDAGIPLAIGSDAEGRTPGMNPFLNIMLVSRSAGDRASLNLTREEAIAAYTFGRVERAMVQRRTSGGKCPKYQITGAAASRSRFVDMDRLAKGMNPWEQDTASEPRGNFVEPN